MNKEILFKNLFNLSSIITDHFPKKGAAILDVSVRNILGNKLILNSLEQKINSRIKKLKNPDRFLVVSDLNIGDAVIVSNGVEALRQIFPRAEIDFVTKKSTKDFLLGNPATSNLFPIYTGAPFPTENDLIQLVEIVNAKNYDLIINFSPMIEDKIFGNNLVVNVSAMAAKLIRNEGYENVINNITYQTYFFIKEMFKDFIPKNFEGRFEGAKIYLPEDAVETAEKFLLDNEISVEEKIVMYNPDASARFTRMPLDMQVELLKGLSDSGCTILLGAGHVEKNIEFRLYNILVKENRKNIFIVPKSFSIVEYAALIDFSDVFITGDTGPLHLAAARKFFKSTGKSMQNRTAIFSVFGSTPPRIYGYDSVTKGFYPANQDAPSRAFVSNTECRNITCINKLEKTCKEVKCFQSLHVEEIISESLSYLDVVKKAGSIKDLVS